MNWKSARSPELPMRLNPPSFRSLLPLLLLTASLVAVTGCSHRARVSYAPPPAIGPNGGAQPSYSRAERADWHYVQTHRPLYYQIGMASWYGPQYNHHRAADGQVYDQDSISAAHRTLPLGSIIKVTNMSTGQTSVMRVTDRGPFVPGRILDLSEAAAKQVGIWREGVGKVRIDVYYTPASVTDGGRWAVQIGAFRHRRAATRLEDKLQRRYRTASVIEFKGPTGDWVRIRPENGNRAQAVEIARNLRPSEGEAYLVRLD
ncbi:rare lipoprotein A family protein [Acidobacterium capsulatum ATCC 51196]|uniref:Probable endolytic peptidoglycan transglycosylase RlpA n=2 Tax=Acidobacteriaceae TaxID=204434 RepID=C1F3R3_ACIC5|nr:rare lipoprotein A family protein [Acidobacterium capsulatum ATCC 51196]